MRFPIGQLRFASAGLCDIHHRTHDNNPSAETFSPDANE